MKGKTEKRDQKRAVLSPDQKRVFFLFAINATLLTIFTLLLANGVAFYSVNVNSYKELNNCIDDCVSSKCTIKTCRENSCINLFIIPGCCEDNVNCTQQESTANYAFNTVCSNEIDTCDPVENSMLHYSISKNVVSNSHVSINGMDGDYKLVSKGELIEKILKIALESKMNKEELI